MNVKTASLLTFLTFIGHIICISAQSEPTLSSNVGATIIEAITLSETASMHFGTNSQINHAKGTVILATDSNARTYTGGLASGGTTNQKATNAIFEVSGASLATYALTLPKSITLKHTSIGEGINTMDVTAIKARFNGADTDATTSTISEKGTDSFALGATLNVQENQIFGQYAATYNVSVDYN